MPDLYEIAISSLNLLKRCTRCDLEDVKVAIKITQSKSHSREKLLFRDRRDYSIQVASFFGQPAFIRNRLIITGI